MAYLQFRDQRVTLTSADQAIGAFDGAALRIPGDDPTARAMVRLAADGTGVITRGSPEAIVSVNGVQLGAVPSPLLHGDKVELVDRDGSGVGGQSQRHVEPRAIIRPGKDVRGKA